MGFFLLTILFLCINSVSFCGVLIRFLNGTNRRGINEHDKYPLLW